MRGEAVVLAQVKAAAGAAALAVLERVPMAAEKEPSQTVERRATAAWAVQSAPADRVDKAAV